MTKLTRKIPYCILFIYLPFRLCFVSLHLRKVTEKRQTTEHEEYHDSELPEEDDNQSAGSRERIEQAVSRFRFGVSACKKCRPRRLINTVVYFFVC